ncbi:hypothetical protein [Limobrevibacterium gyesilva]|uniref:Lipoprotein n=1 Tax=Limobrevibacterium gyesilva TaxID=2991712 RepID=A0AA41YU04_9PROT|nr:hypothetical protein [Limobrevibacterium gyesilva]MCW3476543.1 hypothetical protein [Limobrevibacterium gyesilva]
MFRGLPILMALLLAGCSTALTRQTRYTGTMTPSGACGSAGQATLVVMDRKANFVPNDGALVVPGDVAPDGTLSGGLELLGADRKPFPLALQGHVDADRAEGSYTTPRCRFTLDLRRVPVSLLP